MNVVLEAWYRHRHRDIEVASTAVVVEGILMIAAVVAASVFASMLATRLFEIRDTANEMLQALNDRAKTSIMIIYATYVKTSTTGYFVVYAMNTGKTGIVIPKLEIYLGNYTRLDPYTYAYDGTVSPGEWTYDEVYGNGDGIWSPGEAIAIYIYNTTAIMPPYVVKIVTQNGVVSQEVFTQLP